MGFERFHDRYGVSDRAGLYRHTDHFHSYPDWQLTAETMKDLLSIFWVFHSIKIRIRPLGGWPVRLSYLLIAGGAWEVWELIHSLVIAVK
jgi:hypothetical protein